MLTLRTVGIVGILALFVAVFFFDVLLGDNVLLTESPFNYAPWSAYAGEKDLTAQAGRVDCLRAYLPRLVEVSRSIRLGRLPLWNPYIFAGTPFLADPQSRAVYPVSLLLGLADPVKAMGYDVALHTLIAMIGMFLFMRAAKATAYGSMIGALAYGFSAFFFTRHGHPTFVASASWIPLIFYGFELSRKRMLRGTLLLTVFLVMGYLSGHPQVFLFGVCALVLYAILMCVEDAGIIGTRRALSNLKVIGIAGLLSILLVAIQLVPFLEFLNNSVGLETEMDPGDITGPYQSHPLFLTRVLFPNLFGNPLEGTSWVRAVEIDGVHYSPALIYCGVGAVLLALGSAVFIKVSRHIRAMFVILALSIAIGTGSVIFKGAVSILPLLGYTSIGRITVVSCFALAALAGMGYSLLTSAGNERLKKYSVYIAACVVGSMVVVLLALVFQGDAVISRLMRSIEASIDALADRERSMVFMKWIAEGPAAWLAYETKQVTIGTLFGVLSLILIGGHLLRRSRKRLVPLVSIGLILLLAIDLGMAARSYYESHPGSSFFETEGIRTLRASLGPFGRWRILSYGPRKRVFTPNTNQIFGICSVQGRGTIIPDTFPYILRQSRRGDTPGLKPRDAYRRSVSSIANLMSVRFLLVQDLEPAWLASPVLRAIAADEDLQAQLKLVRMEGKSRLSFAQSVGESLSLGVYLPPAKSLDLAIGLEMVNRSECDSVAVVLRCDGVSGSAEIAKYLEPDRDRGEWHPLSLDIASTGSGPGKITLATRLVGARSPVEMAVAWSGLEFVDEHCHVTRAEGAYQVTTTRPDLPLSLEIASDARQVPLRFRSGDSPSVIRWPSFLPGTTSRRVTLDVAHLGTERLSVTSDSSFTLQSCKSVYTGARWVQGYEVFYDGDMLILENLTTHAKGICLDTSGASLTTQEGRSVLQVSPDDSLDLFRCGDCEIVSYEPEAIELAVTADRDGYLIFQDTYYPGWKARVDGRPGQILRTDMGIRAIAISKGDHSVIMEYRPRSYNLGLVLTLIGVVLTLVWARASGRYSL